MKKPMFKVASCALALGLISAPVAANAQTPVVKAKTVEVKKAVKKLTVKEKQALQQLAPIIKNVNKVETSYNKLILKAEAFYGQPQTADSEKEVYNSTKGKMKAYSSKLNSYKKQLDKVAKKYGKTDAVKAKYEQIAALQAQLKEATTKLEALHKAFVPVKVEVPADQTTAIQTLVVNQN